MINHRRFYDGFIYSMPIFSNFGVVTGHFLVAAMVKSHIQISWLNSGKMRSWAGKNADPSASMAGINRMIPSCVAAGQIGQIGQRKKHPMEKWENPRNMLGNNAFNHLFGWKSCDCNASWLNKSWYSWSPVTIRAWPSRESEVLNHGIFGSEATPKGGTQKNSGNWSTNMSISSANMLINQQKAANEVIVPGNGPLKMSITEPFDSSST